MNYYFIIKLIMLNYVIHVHVCIQTIKHTIVNYDRVRHMGFRFLVKCFSPLKYTMYCNIFPHISLKNTNCMSKLG